jgi:hypothetical protein
VWQDVPSAEGNIGKTCVQMIERGFEDKRAPIVVCRQGVAE